MVDVVGPVHVTTFGQAVAGCGIFPYWQELSVLAQRKTSIYRLTSLEWQLD